MVFGCCERDHEHSGSFKSVEFLDLPKNVSFLRMSQLLSLLFEITEWSWKF